MVRRILNLLAYFLSLVLVLTFTERLLHILSSQNKLLGDLVAVSRDAITFSCLRPQQWSSMVRQTTLQGRRSSVIGVT